MGQKIPFETIAINQEIVENSYFAASAAYPVSCEHFDMALRPSSSDSYSSPPREENHTSPEKIIKNSDERKTLLKIDLRVLPILTVIYVLAFLDRVNVGNALLYGLPEDLHLRGNQLNIALSIFFVTYCVFEIPANILMKYLSPHIFLSLSLMLCGIIAIIQGFVQNFGGLVAVRFFLGIVEAGIFPGCFYLIGMWYKPSEAQKRFSFFFNAASFAGAFGGLLASAIGLMDGLQGYRAWRWVFILEGCLTCTVAIVAYFVVADFPEFATWLTEEERAFVVARLAAHQGNSGVDKKITVDSVKVAFSDWTMMPGALMYFSPTVSAYGLAYFIPSIVQTYGYTPIQSQLHSVIPWAAAVVFGMATASFSDHLRRRSPFILIGLCLAITGNLILFTVHTNNKAQFAGLAFYTMGVIAILPIIVCWFSMNLRGHANRAIGTAWQVGFGNIAGIVAVFAFPSQDKPRYWLGYGLGLGCLCLAGLASGAYWVGCRRRNRGADEKKRGMLL